MRNITVLLFFAFFSFLHVHAQEQYTAYLTGNQEVLPVTTNAYGEMNAVLDGDTLRVEGWFDGLSSKYAAEIAGGSHIHRGMAGLNGSILFTLNPVLDADSLGGRYEMADNSFALNALQKEFLRSQGLYFNIHTRNFTGGELRGQILPAEADHYFTNLFGTGEVPSVMSNGSGAVWLCHYDDSITVSGSFNNLESPLATDIAGGVHLHMGYAGQNGPVVIPLNPSTGQEDKNGLFNLQQNTFATSELNDALPERRVYVNVHSDSHRAGEIRGQLTPPTLRVFRAHLSGTQEIPFATTRAGGVAIAELQPDTSLVVSGSFAGLEAPVATDIAGGGHLHNGMAGSNGPVRFPLNLSLGSNDTSGVIEADSNRYVMNIDDLINLNNRNFYVNIHSEQYGGGEIRGQILPLSQMAFVAPLSSIFEIPRASSFGSGTAVLELMGEQLTLSGSFSGLTAGVDTTIAGGAHLHMGYTGENGPVIYPLDIELFNDGLAGVFPAATNTYMLESEQMRAIRNRRIYFNIHSGNFPGGELRGPVAPEANLLYEASLGGGNEVPPFASRGYGGALLEIRNREAVLSGSFSNMVGAFDSTIAGGAHIHSGMAGQNGPIRIGLNAEADTTAGTFPATDNNFAVTDGWIDTLRNWGHYVNIHTKASASGELRGQLLPLAASHYSATLMGLNEVQPVASSGVGAVNLVTNGLSYRVGGSFSALASDFDESIQMGSHIHTGFTGQNGNIVHPLNPQLSGDLRSGLYMPDDNEFELTQSKAEPLLLSRWYVNIHTTDNQAGELRGQLLWEINMAPVPGEIEQPADGANIVLEGDPDQDLTVSWTEASDANPISYIWEVALDSTFQTTFIRFNASNSLGVTLSYGFADTLLMQLGIPSGQTATLYHRVRPTDGSLNAVSDPKSVSLTRGDLTATENPLPEGYTFAVRPNIIEAGDQLKVDLSSPKVENGQLVLVGMDGTPVMKRDVRTDNYERQLQIPVSGLSSGLYYLVWKGENGVIGRHALSILH